MKSSRVFPVLAILLLLTIPYVAHAQQEITINPRVTYEFGNEIEFSASVNSSSSIARAVVFFRVDGDSETSVLTAQHESSAGIFSAREDLSRDPLPPFARLTYWWHLDFADGSSFDSDPYRFQYYDNSVLWNFESADIEQTTFQVFWKSTDSDLGQVSVDIMRSALPVLESKVARPAPDVISVFVYEHADEFPPLPGTGAEPRIGGKAIPHFNTILLAVEDTDEAANQIGTLLPHELAHLFLHARLGDAYNNLPNWLVEGFAVLQETQPDPVLRLALDEALVENDLLSLQSLCGTFPYQTDPALLAYAESASFLQYLLDKYGPGAFSALLDAYQEGASCEDGVSQVFQRDLESLEVEWLSSISSGLGVNFKSFIPWLLLSLPALLLLTYTLILRNKDRREIQHR